MQLVAKAIEYSFSVSDACRREGLLVQIRFPVMLAVVTEHSGYSQVSQVKSIRLKMQQDTGNELLGIRLSPPVFKA
jgi:hypothetical protein